MLQYFILDIYKLVMEGALLAEEEATIKHNLGNNLDITTIEQNKHYFKEIDYLLMLPQLRSIVIVISYNMG